LQSIISKKIKHTIGLDVTVVSDVIKKSRPKILDGGQVVLRKN